MAVLVGTDLRGPLLDGLQMSGGELLAEVLGLVVRWVGQDWVRSLIFINRQDRSTLVDRDRGVDRACRVAGGGRSVGRDPWIRGRYAVRTRRSRGRR